MLIITFMEQSDSRLCHQVWRCIYEGCCSCSEKTLVSLLTVIWEICLRIWDPEMTLVKNTIVFSFWFNRFWSGLHQSVKYQLLRLGSLDTVLFCLSAKHMLYLTCITTLWLFPDLHPVLHIFWKVWFPPLQTATYSMLCHQTSTFASTFYNVLKEINRERNSSVQALAWDVI